MRFIYFENAVRKTAKESIMATVKFKEGKKNETSFDVSGDEEVVFVVPDKNRVMRFIPQGCLKGNKTYFGGLIITSKRVIYVPLAPNKKNYEVQSFYWKDIASAQKDKMPQETEAGAASAATFSITMKPGQTSSCTEGGLFCISMEMNLSNFIGAMQANSAEKAAQDAKYSLGAHAITGESMSKKSYKMHQRAIERGKNMDFSSAAHNQIRDYIVDVINGCVEEAAQG
jgi:hypothetical protein